MSTRGTKFYADWRTPDGTRHRKCFDTPLAAKRHETRARKLAPTGAQSAAAVCSSQGTPLVSEQSPASSAASRPVPLPDLNAGHVEQAQASWAHLSRATRYSHTSRLRRVLESLAASGGPDLVGTVAGVVPPQPRTVRPTENEASRSLGCADLGLRWVVSCALDVGLRHQTAVALTPRHLQTGAIVTATKRGRVVRLPLTPRLHALLTLARPGAGEEDCRVIDLLNNRRAVQGSQTIHERWRRWKKQAGLPPGLLRRDCAHRVYAACGDVRQVQGALGHESPVTTLRYLHLAAPQVTAKAIADSLIGEP